MSASNDYYRENQIGKWVVVTSLKKVRANLTEKMTLEQVLEGRAMLISGGTVFQAKERTSAKALRWETACQKWLE